VSDLLFGEASCIACRVPKRWAAIERAPNQAAGEFRRAQLPLDGSLASLLDAPLISLLNATLSYRTVKAVASMT
jgi:hypothetical protein